MAALYPVVKTYAVGVEVRVSRPLVDRLALMVPLSAGLIDAQFTNEIEHFEWLKNFMQGLYKAENAKTAKSKVVSGVCWQTQLAFGAAVATLSLHKPTNTLPWQLRVECSPDKLRSEGLQALTNCLAEASKFQWNLKAARLASRITRLDIAADIVGVDVAAFALLAPFAKKLVQYKDGQAALETQYGAGTIKVDQKPLFGRVGYRFYDKRKELIAGGVEPMFGEVPICRLERELHWSAATPSLDALVKLHNPMSDLVLAYLPGATKVPGWNDYAFLRSQSGPAHAAWVLGYSEKLLEQLESAYLALPFNAFDRKEWWGYWPIALADVGLSALFLDS